MQVSKTLYETKIQVKPTINLKCLTECKRQIFLKFEMISFEKIGVSEYKLNFSHNDKIFDINCSGNGPLDACLNALKSVGFEKKLIHYEQKALDEEKKGSGATAMTVIKFEAPNEKTVISRGRDESTAQANVKAIFNGLNLIERVK